MEKHQFRESGSWVLALRVLALLYLDLTGQPWLNPSLDLTLLSDWDQQSLMYNPKAALVTAKFNHRCE